MPLREVQQRLHRRCNIILCPLKRNNVDHKWSNDVLAIARNDVVSLRTQTQKKERKLRSFFVVGGDGFEPSKRDATDLQSAPFGHSGTPPKIGAGDGTRTRNLLITNQLLCQLSYTSLKFLVTFATSKNYNSIISVACQYFFQNILHI